MPAKILESDELQTKVPAVTLAFGIGIAVVGFLLGHNVCKLQATDELQKVQYEFTGAEINGLRNDMNREIQLLRKDLDELKNKP